MMYCGTSWLHAFSLRCAGLIVLLTIVLHGGAELVYPANDDRVYSPINHNVTINCDLPFPADEDLELLMWYQGSTFIIYKNSDGTLKLRDPSLTSKFGIVGDNFTLSIQDVKSEDSGSYTCEKTFKKMVNGVKKILEENKTIELIVQDEFDENVTEAVYVDDDDNEVLHVEYEVLNNTVVDDNISIADDVPTPPGMPIIVDINARDASVSWEKSLRHNNSPITNYLINVKDIDTNDWKDSRVILVSGDTNQIIIRDLLPNVWYQIRVIAKNALGNSAPSSESILFITKPEKPSSPPVNLRVKELNSTSITLAWDPPPVETLNGAAGGYTVEYSNVGGANLYEYSIEDPDARSTTIDRLKPFTNYTLAVKFFNDVGSSESAVIQAQTQEGEPYTKYELRVRAETGGGYSDFSDDFYAVTDVGAPSPPTLLNVTVVSQTSVYVQWLPPKKFYKRVDSYFIQCTSRGEDSTSISRTIPGTETKILLPDLPTNKAYTLKISAITNSIYSTSYYIGEPSEEVTFQLEGEKLFAMYNTSEMNTTPTGNAGIENPTIVVESSQVASANAGMIGGITVGMVFIIVALILVIGYRSMTCRKYTRSLYYLAVPTNSQSPQSTVVFPPDTIEEDTKYVEIKVSDFLQHTRDMHANSDDKFSAEFEEISSRTRTDLLADASFLPENKSKNRYVNISAFDHTRVILQPVPGRPKSADYINANFIDGYNKPHAYIATQGPLPHTFADYWRMVWEQGSIVIIMITNLMERGRRKCDMYWPEEGSETYGQVTVKHINTFSRAHYTVRMFSLKSSKNKKKHVSERIVYQYHYTEWPDHGVPEFTLPVLKFIQKSSGENPPGAGPIVIHCSAGVGRTGTYILIESMIKQIKDKGTVNIPAFLLHIRQQRNFLVQTEEQYMLIHDAIAEYILTQGDTEIKEHDISKYLENVTKQSNGEMTSLDIQYSLVTSFSPKPDDMFHALKSVNLCKNRLLDMVPLSVKRVVLPMKPGVDGSDYINATYLQGYNKSNEFIITQHPVNHTVEDFWRMVWDQNTSVIVQLSETDDDEFRSFWPEKDNSMDIGCFKITYREDDDRKTYKIQEFLLQSNQDDYILMTRIIRPIIKWPQECRPLHLAFDFVDEVQTLHRQNDIGPVIVVDKYGGVEATTFCALWTIYDQLQFDKSVNIYQLAKLYHLKRSNCVGTKEDYMFLYRAAESLTKEMIERDHQSSPGSIRLHLGSKKNGALPRSVTIHSKIETDV